MKNMYEMKKCLQILQYACDKICELFTLFCNNNNLSDIKYDIFGTVFALYLISKYKLPGFIFFYEIKKSINSSDNF